jgi:hypothetical protein
VAGKSDETAMKNPFNIFAMNLGSIVARNYARSRATTAMNLLDIVTEANRELRFNAQFRALLCNCDEVEQDRITRSYFEWIHYILKTKQQGDTQELIENGDGGVLRITRGAEETDVPQ